jgi:peptidyl-prolyl cis-trans isomerase A (cyclophilin A)
MKKLLAFSILCLIFLNSFSQKAIPCLIKTSLGDIHIEIYPQKAPLTAANFLKYVDQKLYDGTNFFRVCTPENEKERQIKIEVIQGGDVPEVKQFAPIAIETTQKTGINHEDGTLSMARDTPNSATSSFFICIGNQPELDFAGKRNPDGQGFAAFGRVTKGMNVVRKIQAQKEMGQYLITPVTIHSIKRMERSKN